ncbi:MAG: hypothetical protein KAH23_02960 [Kiritimatiellae bacterium]|nr:hypothetical protein [Kiritimatiellia bacterium]
MRYRVKPLDSFKRNFRNLQKKYRNIKNDVKKLTVELQENPQAGILLQHHCYKIRLVNSSMPTGKSGGFRTIYYFVGEHHTIYLIAIYSKTQKETISENELLELLKINSLDH